MSNLNFGIKNVFSGSSVATNNNTSTPFSSPSKLKESDNVQAPNNLKESDNLNQVSRTNSNTAFTSNNATTLNKLNNRQTLSREDFMVGVSRTLPQPPELNAEAKAKTPVKTSPVKPSIKEDSSLNVLKSKFDSETVNNIKKFQDSPIGPYPRPFTCDLRNSVIKSTSLIQDNECSEVYSKTPFNLAVEIFDHEKVKNDPDLKNSISNLTSKLSTDDKAALAYIKTILDRKPPISNETTKAVLDKVSNMLTSTYDPRMGDTKAFVTSAFHDVAMPLDISQEEIGTCVGTSIQIQLAIRNPLEYLNMIDTLSKNQTYKSIKGFDVPPNFTFANEGSTTHDSKRTISSKIMQNTIMDYADAETRNYDSSKKDQGITTDQTPKSLNEIVGLDVGNHYVWDYTGTQIFDMLQKSKPSYTNPVEISLSYEEGGRDALHSVNVVALDQNNVTIANPWGREETFPVQDLKTRIMSVSYDKSIDKGIVSINTTDNDIKNNLIDNNKKTELLNKLNVKDKADLIENAYAPWDNKSAYKVKDTVSENDKKMIINILDDLTQGGIVQNKVFLPRIKHFAPDINLFLNKIDNGSEQFTKVKEKIVALNT